MLESFTEIANSPSWYRKQELLKKVNPDLREAFRLAIDPSILFGVKQIPEYKKVSEKYTFKVAIDLLHKFLEEKPTGGAARQAIVDILSNVKEGDAEVLKFVITKNLRCGVNLGMFTRVFPGIIEVHEVMLCSPWKDDNKLMFPLAVQPKLDGMRVSIKVSDSKRVTFVTRNGKTFELFGNLENEFSQFPGFVFDGELLVVEGGKVLERKTGNGILTKFLKGTGTKAEADKVIVHVWDCIPYSNFEAGFSSVKYMARLGFLEPLKKLKSPKIVVVETTVVTWTDQIFELYDKYRAQGEEGVIVKDLSQGWRAGRVNHQLKLKAEEDIDIRCVGVTPGTGKYTGLIGSLVCENNDIKVSVGTGLSDEDRARSPSDYIGRILTVKYNAIVTDKKTGQKSLFLPVFVEIREDKDS